MALLITLLVSILLLKEQRSYEQIEKICDNALGPICAIVLVTGAGGMFGSIARERVGDALSGALSEMPGCRLSLRRSLFPPRCEWHKVRRPLP